MGGDDIQHVLYDHAHIGLTGRYFHKFTLMAFSPKLTYEIALNEGHSSERFANSIKLGFMQDLQYSHVPDVIAYGAKSESTVSPIEVEWEVGNFWYNIGAPSQQNVLAMVNEVFGTVSGWTAILVTDCINLLSLRDRSIQVNGRSFCGKSLEKVRFKWTDGNLEVWKCGELIRMFWRTGYSEWHYFKIYSWTLRAKQGEIFVPDDAGSELKIQFELKTRSRHGDHISLTKDNWFDLPEGHEEQCGDSIVIGFRDTQSYNKFCQRIPAEFWRGPKPELRKGAWRQELFEI